MVLRDLLAGREVLIDLLYFRGLCGLFSLLGIKYKYSRKIDQNNRSNLNISTAVSVVILQQSSAWWKKEMDLP